MITLLIAPELLEDLGFGEVPYLRDATADEVEVFRSDHPQLNHLDTSGRPYFATVVDTGHPDCPPALAAKAKTTLRLRWL